MDIWTIVGTLIAAFVVKKIIQKTKFTQKLSNALKHWIFGQFIIDNLLPNEPESEENDKSTTENSGKSEVLVKQDTNGLSKTSNATSYISRSIVLVPKNLNSLQDYDRVKVISMIAIERAVDAVLPLIIYLVHGKSK